MTVTDADLNVVATSPALSVTEWRIPRSLTPGAVYSWQVTALKEGKPVTSPVLPAPQAKFKIVDRDFTETIAQLKRSNPTAHLALGVAYANAGLFSEAERELQMLLRANPDNRTARSLFRSVQALNQKSSAQ